jgi:phosphoglycerate kinase
MKPLSELDVKGKRILIRVDLNSPVEGGKIKPNPRLVGHAKSIAKLSDSGAKVIVLSHQGRKGESDFISLEQHAGLLSHMIGKSVYFVDDVIGEKAKAAIKKLKDGEMLVLENVRTLEDEGQENGRVVKELCELVDVFALDALSVAHRKHASIVGFPKHLPSVVGDILYHELQAIKKVEGDGEVTFFFGGAKVSDSFSVLKNWLVAGKVNKILVGGALAILLLHAKGYNVSRSIDYLRKKGLLVHLEEAKQLLKNYESKIVLPKDVAFSVAGERVECSVGDLGSFAQQGEISDIGKNAMEEYSKILRESKVIIANGPAGVYEIDAFATGTKAVLEAISQSSGFSLLGGGHTIAAMEKFCIDKKKFGYVSLSGKALIEHLSGKKLPGLEALEQSHKEFFKEAVTHG